MKQVPGACGALVCCVQSAPAQGPACLGLRLAAPGVDCRGRGVEPQAVSSAQPAVDSCSLWRGLPLTPSTPHPPSSQRLTDSSRRKIQRNSSSLRSNHTTCILAVTSDSRPASSAQHPFPSQSGVQAFQGFP